MEVAASRAVGRGTGEEGVGGEGLGGARAVVTDIRAPRRRLVSVHTAHMASSRVRLWGGMALPAPQLWISGSCHRGGIGLAPKCVDSAMTAIRGCLGRRAGGDADGKKLPQQPLLRRCPSWRPRGRQPEVSLRQAGQCESVDG